MTVSARPGCPDGGYRHPYGRSRHSLLKRYRSGRMIDRWSVVNDGSGQGVAAGTGAAGPRRSLMHSGVGRFEGFDGQR